MPSDKGLLRRTQRGVQPPEAPREVFGVPVVPNLAHDPRLTNGVDPISFWIGVVIPHFSADLNKTRFLEIHVFQVSGIVLEHHACARDYCAGGLARTGVRQPFCPFWTPEGAIFGALWAAVGCLFGDSGSLSAVSVSCASWRVHGAWSSSVLCG